MATDIVAIIGHNLSLKEIIDLPKLIDNLTELKELWISEHQSNEHHFTKDSLDKIIQKQSQWNREVTESTLIDFWIHNENLPDDFNQYFDINLHTFFGWIMVNRHTLKIKLLPEHKYANLFYHHHCKFIISFNRTLAEIFGQDKIIYAADSYFSYIIEDKATEGLKIDQVIEFGINEFGIPPTSLEERIKNLFFIDTISDPLSYFDNLTWGDCNLRE